MIHRLPRAAHPNIQDVVSWDRKVCDIFLKLVCLLDIPPCCAKLHIWGWCRGQGEALNIDRRDLYARLYACIPELALLPLQPDDGNLDDLLSQGKALPPHTSQMSSVDMLTTQAVRLVQ